jgi:hypothetical protein
LLSQFPVLPAFAPQHHIAPQVPAIAGCVTLVNTGRMQMRHLLGIEGLNPVAVTAMLDLAENYVLSNSPAKGWARM